MKPISRRLRASTSFTQQIGGRPVDALLANAGRGLGKGFLDQDFEDVMRVVNTNITGTIYLIQKLGRDMRVAQERAASSSPVLSRASCPAPTRPSITPPRRSLIPSRLRSGRRSTDSGVTVTCLMPGATETEFFERADMLDTKVGQGKKDDPADVAATGFKAMMKGEGDVVSGWHNKLQSAIATGYPLLGPRRAASQEGRARLSQALVRTHS